MGGPQEQRLRTAVTGASSSSIRRAQGSWYLGAEALRAVARALATAAPVMETKFAGETGVKAAGAFAVVQQSTLDRAGEMADAANALLLAAAALDEAQRVDTGLGPEPAKPTMGSTVGLDDVEALRVVRGYSSRMGTYQTAMLNREETAFTAANDLDSRLQEAADILARIHGDPQTGSAAPAPAATAVGSSGGGTGGGSAGGSPGGTSGPGVGATPPGGSSGTTTDSGTTPDPGPGTGGPPPGADPAVAPTGAPPGGPGDPGQPAPAPTGSGPAAVPGAVGGGITGAVGGAAIGGMAGISGAVRGGAGTAAGTPSGAVPGAPGARGAGSGGAAIGSTTRAAGARSLGARPSAASPGTPTRGGGASRAAGTTPGSARTPVAGSTAGRGSGGRGAGAVAGGRGSRARDRERQAAAGYLEDVEDWLDDEDAAPGVID